jgi:biotin carboxyl carrier protein
MAAIASEVAQVISLFNHSDLVELSIEQGGRRLYLRKGEGMGAEPPVAIEAPPEPAAATIKAHMVGIFYWTKDKTGRPAVALHQLIEKGQIVGFVEAMGIMNEVEAGQAGTVVEIAVAGGQPVEYGQPLVELRVTG